MRAEEWGRKEKVNGGESGARRNDERDKKEKPVQAQRKRKRKRLGKVREGEGSESTLGRVVCTVQLAFSPLPPP